MRPSTFVLLVAAIFALALFGWKAVGAVALAAVLLVLAILVAIVLFVAVGIWLVKRRLRKEVERFAHNVLEQAPTPNRPGPQASMPHAGPRHPGGPDVIDVEPIERPDDPR